MKKLLLCIILIYTNFAFSQKQINAVLIIEWVDSLEGDFSFKDSWSYEEGYHFNDFGQLICDGNCPLKSYNMLDSLGRIYKDSMAAYYKIVDTTHQYHTISCDAWCYEWAGTNFISVKRKNEKEVLCNTMCNAGTHSSLEISIDGNFSTHSIQLISIIPNGNAVFQGSNGSLKIDKNLWKKGIMKAVFDFQFHSDNDIKNMFWKGKIYAPISQ